MSILDRIEDFEKSFVDETVVTETAIVPEWVFEGEEILSESEMVMLEGAGAPDFVGFKGDMFIVGNWAGKSYAYKLDWAQITPKMKDKYGSFGPTGAQLTGDQAKAEFVRRQKSQIGRGLWLTAFNRDIIKFNPTGRIPYAGGVKSPAQFDARWIDGSTTQPVIAGVPVTPARQVPGVNIPQVGPGRTEKPAIAHAHATNASWSPQLMKVLADADALRNEIHKLTYADFNGQSFEPALHAAHDALAKLSSGAKVKK